MQDPLRQDLMPYFRVFCPACHSAADVPERAAARFASGPRTTSACCRNYVSFRSSVVPPVIRLKPRPRFDSPLRCERCIFFYLNKSPGTAN